ncbi:MAG: hypothetical protein RL042_2271 [Nitrospirota bacterium]|jgi:hypothetical protein
MAGGARSKTVLKPMPPVTVLAILLWGTASAEWKIAYRKVSDDGVRVGG